MNPVELARYEKGIAVADVAKRFNVSERTVTRWERQETRPPAPAAAEMARLYGITVAELLGLTERAA